MQPVAGVAGKTWCVGCNVPLYSVPEVGWSYGLTCFRVAETVVTGSGPKTSFQAIKPSDRQNSKGQIDSKLGTHSLFSRKSCLIADICHFQSPFPAKAPLDPSFRRDEMSEALHKGELPLPFLFLVAFFNGWDFPVPIIDRNRAVQKGHGFWTVNVSSCCKQRFHHSKKKKTWLTKHYKTLNGSFMMLNGLILKVTNPAWIFLVGDLSKLSG